MWADQNDLSGFGEAATTTVAIQPTTQDQVFNTINLVAQGILNERIAKQNVKMTEAQATAATEQAKASATNYVMQQLQKGEAILMPKTAPVTTPGWASWGSKILVIGGVALLGYVLWKKYGKRLSGSSAPVAANPRRRKHRR
jgi:hypothetical protein